MAKAIYLGHNGRAKSFYTQIKGNNVKGYSKTIEENDLLVFDKDLQERPLRVVDVKKRNYNGVFENPEDAINAFFDANTIPISDDELKELRSNKEFQSTIVAQYI